MNGDHDSPFGPDTITLDAVIVRDGEDKPPSRHAVAIRFGADVLTIPAVLVPSGGSPPAGDWLKCGEVRLPRKHANAAPGAAGAPDSTSSPDGPTAEG